MKEVRTKRYYINRIYLVAIMFYYFLTLPLLGFIWIKQAPDLLEKRTGIQQIMSGGGDLIHPSTAEQEPETVLTFNNRAVLSNGSDVTINAEDNVTGKTIRLTFKLILIGGLLFFILNYPFRNYMKRKRQGKELSGKQQKFVRKFITRIPVASAVVLLVIFTIIHVYMVIKLRGHEFATDMLEKELYTQYFYISMAAALLSSFFVFLWQRHRVHLLYLECVFSDDDLRTSVFNQSSGSISRRLNTVSLVTVIIPLAIMMMYLQLGTTRISEMGELSKDKMEILLGPYANMPSMMNSLGNQETLSEMKYVNVLDQLVMFIGIITGMITAVIFLFFIIKWNSQYIVTPVNELVEKMRLTGRGELNTFGKVKTNDEIGELTQGYNEMSGKLSHYITNLKALSNANSRFVPSEMISALGKNDITDVELGDQTQKEMTILFSDIRSFTTLSESMTPKETFDFINEYLGIMEPEIRRHNGFIDKYIGDAIMALFEEPADACSAAESMQQSLKLFNSERLSQGKPEIKIGIGLNTGNMMLGIVGGEGRISGTVISDAVNTASRLEGLTKKYLVPIIISEKTKNQLPPLLREQCRYIDIVVVRGKKEPVKIFEFFAHDNAEKVRFIRESQTSFDSALTLYFNKQFADAEEIFTFLHKAYPADPLPQLYLDRCRSYNTLSIPENWNGVALKTEKN